VYPYDRRPDARPGDMAVIERFFEPTVTLAYLAGQTSRVRLGVSAYVLPYRNPVVTAKQIATLDVLSGGRVVLAVGTGWLREEFEALDVPFAGRGRRTEEYLAVCRALWRGGDADKVRRDLDAYRDAGLDYLVVGLRHAKTPDELSRAMADVVEALGR